MSQTDQQTPAGVEPSAPRSPEVLIVGAGPIGMILACELLQQNVAVLMIDQEPVPAADDDPHSRGILIWPRTLELLRRIGVSDALIAAGHRSAGVGYYSSGRRLITADLSRLPDSPANFVLTLPQRNTERILRARLAELGGTVLRGSTLEALDTSGPLPRARIRHLDGTVEESEPLWLVGADGPASTVRTLLGIGFEGEAIDVTYAIGDAPVSGRTIAADAQYYYSRTGVVALVPLANGHYRIAANVPHRTEADGDPSAELLRQVISERAKAPDVVVGTPEWTRSFRPRLGIADRFRSGRCFLIGDAAHVISPAGGQGMNVGVQDAVNLGWKLGGVLRGTLPQRVLDSYEPERLTSAHRMSRTTAAQARFALQRDTRGIARRDAAVLAARASGMVSRVLVPLLSQTDDNYIDPDTRPLLWRHRGTARAGQRVPFFATPHAGSGLPAIDPYRYSILLSPGRRLPADWQEQVAAVRLAAEDRYDVVDLSGVGSPRGRRILRRVFGPRPTISLVRPDGHLEAVAGTDQTAQMLAAATAVAAEDAESVLTGTRP